MFRTTPALLWILAAQCFAACGAGQAKTTDGTQDVADAEKAAPADAKTAEDYGRMRMELAASEGYDAYAIQIGERLRIDQAMKRWKSGDVVSTLKELIGVLDFYPTSIEAHRRLADMFEIVMGQAKDPEARAAASNSEKYYRAIADGLVQSILDSGDGKTPESAYQVINISEEYMVLLYLGLKRTGQALVQKDGKTFDRLEVQDAQGAISEIHFDVSLFFRR